VCPRDTVQGGDRNEISSHLDFLIMCPVRFVRYDAFSVMREVSSNFRDVRETTNLLHATC